MSEPSPSRRRGPGGPNEEGVRRVRRRRRRAPTKDEAPKLDRARLVWALGVALGLALAGTLTWLLLVFPTRHGPGGGRVVELVVAPGEGSDALAARLAAEGLVGSPRTFALYLRLTSLEPAAGAHLLSDDLSPGELARRLGRRSAERIKVTFPEGFNRFDMAKRLAGLKIVGRDAFLAASRDPALLHELGIPGDSAEGFLFPATYELPGDADPRDVVRRLKAEFDRRFGQLEQTHRLARGALEANDGLRTREIVTLASLVEKEAAVDEERPLVAAVFLNRLREPSFRPKLLQSDPSSGYGCLVAEGAVPACAGFTGKITPAINADPANPYSTYVREGLPPGPIANPGAKSLAAVLEPARTRALYFVARGQGRHVFSETLEEHNAAVRELRARRAGPDRAPAEPGDPAAPRRAVP